MQTRALTTSLFALLLASPMVAQDLRKGLLTADLLVAGRQVSKQDFNADVTFHKVQVLRTIRGEEHATVTVLDWPKLSLHNRPTPRQTRLYCLQDASVSATKAGLPTDQGPYYKMVGWSGTNPLLGENLDKDPVVNLATILATAEKGNHAGETATELCNLALQGDPAVRTEATLLLTERPLYRSQLSTVHWSQLVQKAAGELDDMPFKIALAELCSEQRVAGLLEALIVSLGPVKDADFARCVGRIASLQGESSAQMLLQRLQTTNQPEVRSQILLALGASNTDAALQALLEMRRFASKDVAVEAALREHRSPRAQEAVLQGKK